MIAPHEQDASLKEWLRLRVIDVIGAGRTTETSVIRNLLNSRREENRHWYVVGNHRREDMIKFVIGELIAEGKVRQLPTYLETGTVLDELAAVIDR